MQIDGQYRKFARLLLGFENLLVAGWREQAKALLTRTFKQPLLCEAPGFSKLLIPPPFPQPSPALAHK